ncbi:hypothetical protein [Helicobacter pylori]|uniref:hypothetical protein n=1 Tax=Helicobacter pylori TaxID=210 RepID=UPI002FBD81A8
MKVFYYIISKLNSINDKGFEVCEIPINEILWEVLEHENLDANYLYIKKLFNLNPPKQKSQTSLVFGMNAIVPLGTIKTL